MSWHDDVEKTLSLLNCYWFPVDLPKNSSVIDSLNTNISAHSEVKLLADIFLLS